MAVRLAQFEVPGLLASIEQRPLHIPVVVFPS
jgi:hypothetical protein